MGDGQDERGIGPLRGGEGDLGGDGDEDELGVEGDRRRPLREGECNLGGDGDDDELEAEDHRYELGHVEVGC